LNVSERNSVLICGGGIGGLAAALAVSRAGWRVNLLEKASIFSEVGAGIQLGPNVVKVLRSWDLAEALGAVAAFPGHLYVRDALTGAELGHLRLGKDIEARYGAPYATIHRADLHVSLLAAVQHTRAVLRLDTPLRRFKQSLESVTAEIAGGQDLEADILVGADGLWSTVRQQLLGDGPPRRTGHLAYRALVPQAELPARLRAQNISVWMGRHMHVVHYPVRRGELLNVVAFVHGNPGPDEIAGWDHGANAADLSAALDGAHVALRDLVGAIANWRLWPMCDRPPMQGPHEHALGRVALLGDAAHPMRPYLAQGAGMAIEDAFELGEVLRQVRESGSDTTFALQRFAQNRWQRNARVQARALRNGEVFHADGLMRWGRDAAMKLLGEKLLDMPWLYGAGPKG
jgi:salicylate hydroxylase